MLTISAATIEIQATLTMKPGLLMKGYHRGFLVELLIRSTTSANTVEPPKDIEAGSRSLEWSADKWCQMIADLN